MVGESLICFEIGGRLPLAFHHPIHGYVVAMVKFQVVEESTGRVRFGWKAERSPIRSGPLRNGLE